MTSPADTLTVTAATVVSIAVTPAAPSIPSNGSQQFTAIATMSFGPTVDVTANPLTTWATGTPAVASIGLHTGLALGVAAGTSAITANFGGVTSPADTLTVTAATVVSIAVTPSPASVSIGSTIQFTAIATMSFGPTVDVTANPLTTWATGTPAVASIGLNTGLATGVTSGTSLITATFGGKTSPASTLTVSPAPVPLGLAGNYASFGGTGISNATAGTVITGDIGVGPGVTSTAITGFALILPAASPFSTSTQVTGKVYAFDYAAPTPTNVTTASTDLLAAYNNAAGRPAGVGPYLNPGLGGAIGGLTLTPGTYTWGSNVAVPFGTNLTLSGGPNDVWIFQITGTFTMGAATSVNLIGGALPKNIFWQVGGTNVTLGANAHLEGVVLSAGYIAFGNKASANSRLLSQTAVNLDQNAVTQPAP